MTLLKISILSLLLLSSLNAAEDKKAAVTNVSYENIKTVSSNGATEAYALKSVFDNLICPSTRIKIIGSAVCSEGTSNVESKLWECVVIYSCTNE